MPSVTLDENGSIEMIYIQGYTEVQQLSESKDCRLAPVSIKFRSDKKDQSTLVPGEALEGRVRTSCQDLVTVIQMIEQSGRRAHEIYLSGSHAKTAAKAISSTEFRGSHEERLHDALSP
jgi:hypothetical protein